MTGMMCANCVMRDGTIYTSLPPKIKCPFTGKFNFLDHGCDVDFQPVVRCKNCKYLEEDECPWAGVIDWNGFCSKGEKREEDNEVY